MSDSPSVCEHLRISTVYPINLPVAVHICGECGERLTDAQARAEKITFGDMNVNLGVEIAKALAIDMTWVTSLRLEMCPGGVPVLEISRAILGDDHAILRSVMERFRVTPIVSAPQADSQASTESD